MLQLGPQVRLILRSRTPKNNVDYILLDVTNIGNFSFGPSPRELIEPGSRRAPSHLFSMHFYCRLIVRVQVGSFQIDLASLSSSFSYTEPIMPFLIGNPENTGFIVFHGSDFADNRGLGQLLRCNKRVRTNNQDGMGLNPAGCFFFSSFLKGKTKNSGLVVFSKTNSS